MSIPIDITGESSEMAVTMLVSFNTPVSTKAGMITPVPEGFRLQYAGEKRRETTYAKALPAVIRLRHATK